LERSLKEKLESKDKDEVEKDERSLA